MFRSVGNSGIKLVSTNKSNDATPPAKKIFITKDGKVIGHQIAAPPGGKMAIAPSSTTPNKLTPGASPATPVQQQKVQIVKSADGKIQVRGLLPGETINQSQLSIVIIDQSQLTI